MKLQGIALKNLLSLIKHYEGCKLEPYTDSIGIWTEGVGHCILDENGKRTYDKKIALKNRKVFTQNDADLLLISDLEKFEKDIDSLGLIITDNQKAALISFAFNLGFSNLKNSKLLGYIKKKSNPVIIDAGFMSWVSAGGKKLDGLIARRSSEAFLFRYGELKYFNN